MRGVSDENDRTVAPPAKRTDCEHSPTFARHYRFGQFGRCWMPFSEPAGYVLAEYVVPPAFAIGPALRSLDDRQDIDKFGLVPNTVMKKMRPGP
jgi:hypothetical protein